LIICLLLGLIVSQVAKALLMSAGKKRAASS
jgi:hypothetical protein